MGQGRTHTHSHTIIGTANGSDKCFSPTQFNTRQNTHTLMHTHTDSVCVTQPCISPAEHRWREERRLKSLTTPSRLVFNLRLSFLLCYVSISLLPRVWMCDCCSLSGCAVRGLTQSYNIRGCLHAAT